MICIFSTFVHTGNISMTNTTSVILLQGSDMKEAYSCENAVRKNPKEHQTFIT